MIEFLLAFAARLLILCLLLITLAAVIGRFILCPDIIVYIGIRDDQWDVYVMDMTAFVSVNLTRDRAQDAAVIWSPDGSSIAYNSYRDQNWDIYRMPMTGGESIRLGWQ